MLKDLLNFRKGVIMERNRQKCGPRRFSVYMEHFGPSMFRSFGAFASLGNLILKTAGRGAKYTKCVPYG